LIAEASGREKPYATGDDVPGGATLHSIEEDRVILERNGRFETLKLERNKPGSKTATVASVAPPPRSTGPINSLGALKNEALRDPSVANQYVRVQPAYQEGKLAGYRIYPGPNSALFQQAGLRAGELVTSVNGIQLDDTAKALQLMGDLRDIGAVTLTLERAGETRTVNLNLNQ
jgi:general secretion pathway protein C